MNLRVLWEKLSMFCAARELDGKTFLGSPVFHPFWDEVTLIRRPPGLNKGDKDTAARFEELRMTAKALHKRFEELRDVVVNTLVHVTVACEDDARPPEDVTESVKGAFVNIIPDVN